MTGLPPLESIACPNCQAHALQASEKPGEAICANCGQEMEVTVESGGKRRNYTPDRGLRHVLPVTPPPAGGLPKVERLPEKFKAVHKVEPLFQPVTAPSHALESVQRSHGKKIVLAVVVLGVVLAAGLWIFRTKGPGHVAVGMISGPKQVTPMVSLLAAGYEGDVPDDEIEEAEVFLKRKVLAAGSPEEWLGVARKRDQVEPLLRAFYQKHPFQPLGELSIVTRTGVSGPAGRFVVFGMQGGEPDAIMVELTGSGPLLDWEILARYPLHQWKNFLDLRPADPETLAVLMARCDVPEQALREPEKESKDRLLAVRMSVPGAPGALVALVPLGDPLAEWVRLTLPWDHSSRGLPMRATLSFPPDEGMTPERVRLHEPATPTWNR